VIFVFVVLFILPTLILFNTYIYVLSLCIKFCQKVDANTLQCESGPLSFLFLFDLLVEDCF
jgi:hypothetical protein